MRVSQVIKHLKAELKLLKSESEEMMKYSKNPEMIYHIEYIEGNIEIAEAEYEKLLDISSDCNKEKLIIEINQAYDYLAKGYDSLNFRSTFSFLKEFGHEEEINGMLAYFYIDAKREMFKRRADEFKKIKF